MTISSQTRKAGPFHGNDLTTVFPFAFKVFAASDLLVVRLNTAAGVESTLTLNTDYTVSLNANQDSNPGGSITLNAALASGFDLTLTSLLQYTQLTDLTNAGGFYPKVVTNALDRLTIFCQQLFDSISRSLRFPVSDSSTSTTLPPAAQRANKLLSFDSSGNPIVVAPADQSATALATQLATSTGASSVGYGSTTVKAMLDQLPALAGKALNYLRVNAAATALEVRTPTQARGDIGAAASGANSDITSLTGLTGQVDFAAAVSAASAATVNLGAQASNNVTVTGTTTITSLGTAAAGIRRTVTAAGAFKLTHNATSLILLGGADITAAAGDAMEFVSLGSGNWRCLYYQKADGTPIKLGTNSLGNSGYQKLPGGLILQWGRGTTGNGSATVTFPLAFPSACFAVTPAWNIGSNQSAYAITAGTPTASGFTVFSSAGIAFDFFWFALGN